MSNLARIFISRKFWIALAGVASCLVVVFNADPAKWTPLIASIVTLAGVVIASIAVEDAAEKRNESNPTSIDPTEVRASMPASDVAARGGVMMLLLSCVLLLSGCNGSQSPSRAYVEADRKTFEAIAPAYGRYVTNDPALSAEQIARRQRTVETWRLRIERAERDLEAQPTINLPATQPAIHVSTGKPSEP